MYTCKVIIECICTAVGYLLGLGDRHVQNILIDKNTAEFIHIDLGELFITKALYTIPSRHIIDVHAQVCVHTCSHLCSSVTIMNSCLTCGYLSYRSCI